MTAHPTHDPKYWRSLASDERKFADDDRKARRTFESIRIHLDNAASYEQRALDLEDAINYIQVGWDRLEFEEKAHARNLARKGIINLNPIRLR